MTARQHDAPDCAGRNGVQDHGEHTPGPWDWRNDINGGEYDLSPGILTTDLTDGTPWGDEIDRANARLIAAAPELLEALKAMQPLWHHMIGLSSPAEWHRVNGLMEAAIAKAEGRS